MEKVKLQKYKNIPVIDCNGTRTHNHLVRKQTLNHLWVLIYKLSGCGLEFRCCHLNFKYRACFEQGVPWHSGNYRVWIHSERVRDMVRTYSHSSNSFTKLSIFWEVLYLFLAFRNWLRIIYKWYNGNSEIKQYLGAWLRKWIQIRKLCA